MLLAVARVFAGSLGCFAALNAALGLARPELDANRWLIYLYYLPEFPARLALLAAGVLLALFALKPTSGRTRRFATAGVALLLAAAAAFNAADVWALARDARIELGAPLPFSLFVSAALVLLAMAVFFAKPCRAEAPRWRRWASWSAGATAAAALALLFPLGLMWCFGKTDYRRRADAVVVFGARTYADGSVSDALYDRVRTGCKLVTEGYAKRIVFSGGPGDGAVHETEAMRRLALKFGVPREAILLDAEGLDTRATARNVSMLLDELGCRRVLAVSHAYHLPRVKLAFARAGREVYTVPAHERYTLTLLPYYMARETAAFWYYWAFA
ncbi:MAG: YdcF family protein [Planctomycetes bacterium]|nr:YdcF family protein [Planctomycetota bacterium]